MKKEEIKKLAQLSRIEMSDEELGLMAKDFDSILGYVAQIQEVTTGKGDLKPQVGTHHNIMREDEGEHEGGRYTDKILKNMPEEQAGYLSVKKIL
jgi:aspartyl-tRNA(Asn)/glutamyl-tRNA(Gln) amidotransferase subunit C